VAIDSHRRQCHGGHRNDHKTLRASYKKWKVPLWPSVSATTKWTVPSWPPTTAYHHGEMISIVRHNCLLAFPRWVKAAATTYRNPRSGSQSVQADSRSERPLHPIHSVGRSGGKPHDKLVGNGADSDDDFIPATSRAQEATISHDSPTNFIESSHTTQQHCLTAGVCWKMLCKGAGVLAS
jgi:hypothetical protein